MYAPLWVHNTKLQRWISLTRSFSCCSSTSQSTSLLLSPPCWCVKERALVIPRGPVAIIEVVIGHCPAHRTTTKRRRFSPMSKKIVLVGGLSFKDWSEARTTDQWRQKHVKCALNRYHCHQTFVCRMYNIYVYICVCILPPISRVDQEPNVHSYKMMLICFLPWNNDVTAQRARTPVQWRQFCVH